MRIVAVHEQTIPLATAARNASIGFAGMTASAVAVHTDVQQERQAAHRPGLDSMGVTATAGCCASASSRGCSPPTPDAYDDGCGGIDPHRAWGVAMADEKPGGHGERSGAVGLIDAALWDLAAKMRRPAVVAAARRASTGANAAPRCEVYASGGHYRPEPRHRSAVRRDPPARSRQGHRRFKIKIGGAALADDLQRIEAVLAVLETGMTLAVDGNGTFDRDRRYTTSRRSPTIRWPGWRSRCRRSISSFIAR